MARNVFGSLVALLGAALVALSPFRDWYAGRRGELLRLPELFTDQGVTGTDAALWEGMALPCAVAALLTLTAVILRSRGLACCAGLLALGFTGLWMLRKGLDEGSLTAGGDNGLRTGVALALGGGLLVLAGAAVMAGRRPRPRAHPYPAPQPAAHPPPARTAPPTPQVTSTAGGEERVTWGHRAPLPERAHPPVRPPPAAARPPSPPQSRPRPQPPSGQPPRSAREEAPTQGWEPCADAATEEGPEVWTTHPGHAEHPHPHPHSEAATQRVPPVDPRQPSWPSPKPPEGEPPSEAPTPPTPLAPEPAPGREPGTAEPETASPETAEPPTEPEPAPTEGVDPDDEPGHTQRLPLLGQADTPYGGQPWQQHPGPELPPTPDTSPDRDHADEGEPRRKGDRRRPGPGQGGGGQRDAA
ncbi:hypothetical protein [Streptomyces sp. NPDC005438]|uniref:hypothetical protein n=1 Tax=Streptomyces sp. NPDC005438 TaxID=3156880 RepID=UPI0033AD2138